MSDKERRRSRERRTLKIMVGISCRGVHGERKGLCEECNRLLDYALKRLERCPYGNEKPACSHCPVHCYKDDMRTRIREVMRYAGPRMLVRHPVLALMHMLDAERNPPTEMPSGNNRPVRTAGPR
jgi:hypothetical protein